MITWFPVQFGVSISKTTNCTRKIHLRLLTPHCTWSHVITYTNCIPLTWMTIYLFIKAITCTCWTITEVKQCMVLRETVSFVSWRVLIRTPGKSKLTSSRGTIRKVLSCIFRLSLEQSHGQNIPLYLAHGQQVHNCILVGIHFNLIKGTWPRINQSQCLFFVEWKSRFVTRATVSPPG